MSAPLHIPAQVAQLKTLSTKVRRRTFQMSYEARHGHLGSAFSIIDILTCLYFSYLNIDPLDPKKADRDRFILSKGHGCSSLYTTLAMRGFFPEEELHTFLQDESRLAGHPSSLVVPGVEVSTGSLGHGLPIAVGMALAQKRSTSSSRTVALLSDGECDEGSTWEAVLAAGHWKLSSLTCIVDYNKIQSFGRTKDVMDLEPFGAKWEASNWHVQEIDGHAHEEIVQALAAAEKTQQPSVIIAHTIKGKGVSFMEDTVDWHYWHPNDEQYAIAMEELSLPELCAQPSLKH